MTGGKAEPPNTASGSSAAGLVPAPAGPLRDWFGWVLQSFILTACATYPTDLAMDYIVDRSDEDRPTD